MYIIEKKFSKGFTLIELVVSIACSSLILMGIYQILQSQQQHYMKHDEYSNMKKNIKASMYFVTKDIMSAGFNPTRTDITKIGIVENFSPVNIFSDIGGGDIDYVNEKNKIAFNADKNSNGCIESDNQTPLPNCGTVDPDALVGDGDRGEQIAYRVYDKKLQRFNSEIFAKSGSISDAWQTVATNVDALNFVFLDEDGIVVDDPLKINAKIRSIEMTVLIKTDNKDYKYNNQSLYRNKQGDIICQDCIDDHYRRESLSTTIRTRNL